MEGLYFALSVFAIALVIHWCLTAERVEGGEYRGLLAMPRPRRRSPPPRRGGRGLRSGPRRE